MYEKRNFQDSHRVNNQIRVPQVMLIDQSGQNLGIMTADKARYLARQAELDLVEVAAQAKPPVCRILDYGKFKYEQNLKEKKIKSAKTQIKEIRLRPAIGEADLDTKIKSIKRFIEDDDKVLLKMRLMGRENAHIDLGFEIINKVLQSVQEMAAPKSPPLLSTSPRGNSITCVLEAKKK